MEWILIVAAVLCVVLGLIGTFVPVVPGSPLSFLGVMLLFWVDGCSISLTELVAWGVIMLMLQVFDFVAPAWMAKRGGGSKWGVRGATLGTLVGLFFLPWGLIFGPFVGALVCERIAGTPFGAAWRVAFYSVIGFLLTTGLKLVYGLIVLLYVGYRLVVLLV